LAHPSKTVYYDFDIDRGFSPRIFPDRKKMKEIIERNLPIIRRRSQGGGIRIFRERKEPTKSSSSKRFPIPGHLYQQGDFIDSAGGSSASREKFRLQAHQRSRGVLEGDERNKMLRGFMERPSLPGSAGEAPLSPGGGRRRTIANWTGLTSSPSTKRRERFSSLPSKAPPAYDPGRF